MGPVFCTRTGSDKIGGRNIEDEKWLGKNAEHETKPSEKKTRKNSKGLRFAGSKKGLKNETHVLYSAAPWKSINSSRLFENPQ